MNLVRKLCRVHLYQSMRPIWLVSKASRNHNPSLIPSIWLFLSCSHVFKSTNFSNSIIRKCMQFHFIMAKATKQDYIWQDTILPILNPSTSIVFLSQNESGLQWQSIMANHIERVKHTQNHMFNKIAHLDQCNIHVEV